MEKAGINSQRDLSSLRVQLLFSVDMDAYEVFLFVAVLRHHSQSAGRHVQVLRRLLQLLSRLFQLLRRLF